jgi:acyl-CoA hydrolase
VTQRPTPVRFSDPDDCVEAALTRVGNRVVLGLPVAIGKPNALVNAFVARALREPRLQLTILTALSLRAPRWRSDLERRLVQPLSERIFAGYLELEYVRLLEQRRLPANIEVIEFYLEPGAWLGNAHLQQHYLAANYTHVARDALDRGMNVLAQLVTSNVEADAELLSVGANPDLIADVLPHIAARRASGQPFALIGQFHSELPYMYGDAQLAASDFDLLLDAPHITGSLFCPPNLPIGLTDHAIALHVSTLVRDGGTLQLGIGELGDAIVYALQLRHQQPQLHAQVLQSLELPARQAQLIANCGGTLAFTRGLYACTEMLADGFLDLYHSGVLKRAVYPHAVLQRLLDAGDIGSEIGLPTLTALYAAGVRELSAHDVEQLRSAGVFKQAVRYEAGYLVTAETLGTSGRRLASLATAAHREAIAEWCLGSHLNAGMLADAGFFFGPKAFYAALRDMPTTERRQFAMRGIRFVNELHGPDWELKVAQRRHARFINTTMMVTGLGAAVSDGLGDGRVVSGVGGQYNFVAMAHALPEARSVLCVRATRTAQRITSSNILWSYPHVTIPRHLRDLVVTEYGIADLRGKTDREIVMALLEVMDARFQPDLMRAAQRAGKLPADYRLPLHLGNNTPAELVRRLRPWQAQGLLQELPFGSDFTAVETSLAKALKYLAGATTTWGGRAELLGRLLRSTDAARWQPHLQRMELLRARSWGERVQRQLLLAALQSITEG